MAITVSACRQPLSVCELCVVVITNMAYVTMFCELVLGLFKYTVRIRSSGEKYVPAIEGKTMIYKISGSGLGCSFSMHVHNTET